MSTSSPEDLEDGELPSSDDDCANNDELSTTDNTTVCTKGNTDGVDTPHSTGDHDPKPFESPADPATTPGSTAARKRPFQSPEPEQQDDDHSPSNKKVKTDDASSQSDDLEDGEIYSDDEEAMYYPDLVKSRSSSTVKTDSKSDNTKSSPPRRRYRSESRSRSPIPRDRVFGTNRQGGYNNRYDRKTHSPNKGKDHRGGGWKDHRGGGRSRGRSRGNHEFGQSLKGGRHDRSASGGNTGERWGGGEQDSSNEKPSATLTLEVLEERLKKELAIFPTPNVNPCYSLDEFNYPAPPQWYFRAVNAYNKRNGYKPKGHGGGGWREDGSNTDGYSKVELVSENLGYNQQPNLGPMESNDVVPPPGNALLPPPSGFPMGASPRPTFTPLQGPQPMPGPPPFRPQSIMGMGPPNMGMRPSNMGIGQPIMGMRSPNTGLRLPPPMMGMGPSIMGTGPPIMGTGPPIVGSESSDNKSVPPGMGTGFPLGMGIRPPMQPVGSTIGPPSTAQDDSPTQQQIVPGEDQTKQSLDFDSEIFGSFPTIGKSSTDDDIVDGPHPLISDISDGGNDDDTGDGDLMIAKEEEMAENDEDNREDTQELSPSADIKPSLSVSTMFTKSLGKRGGRKGVVTGSFSTKRGGRPSRQSTKLPKALMVSLDLTKVHLKTISEDHEAAMNSAESEDFNYDDYLDQLNDEEEDEIKPSSTFDSSSFWIDTNPQPGFYSRSNSKENTNSTCSSNDHALTTDPLDEDFPAISATVTKDKTEPQSLRSLVNDDVVDKSIMVEEGKKRGEANEVGGVKKEGEAKEVGGASLKRVEASYWTKQDKTEKRQRSETGVAQGQRIIPPCKFYLQGYCIHGDNCQYNHSIRREKKREMCKFYLQDACDKGNDCIFYHGNFPCKYFHGRHMCYHGDKCKFSHAPLTVEGYDLLMGVLESNLRDQVPFPGQPQPMSNPPPSGVIAPPSHPGPPIQLDPKIPFPPTGGFPPPSQPSGVTGPFPNQPHSHNFIPGPNLVPGPYSQPQLLDVPVHQPHPHSNPNPHSISHPHSNPNPESNPHPQSMPYPQSNAPQVQASDVGDQQPLPRKSNVSCNVSLPVSFEAESLFPDEHPQVLPHDLATQLRKVLLDTPTSTSDEDKKKQEEEEKYELYYWENEDTPTDNDITTDSSISVSTEPHPLQTDMPYITNKAPPIIEQFNRDERPPTTAMPHPPLPQQAFPPSHIEQGGVSTLRPFVEPNHGMLGAPPTQPHPPPHRHGHQGLINPQPSIRSSQNNMGRRLSPDPRMERDPRHDSHDPRSFNQEIQAPPISAPVHNTNPYPPPYSNNPSPVPPPTRPDSYSAPHSNVSNTKLERFNNPI